MTTWAKTLQRPPLDRREVRLIGAADFGFWADHLKAEGLTPVRCGDAAQVVVIAAEMSHLERAAIRAGSEIWEGPVFLPRRGGRNDGRLFLARLSGHTVVAPFSSSDRFGLEIPAGGGLLQSLADAKFIPQEWEVRADATHARPKTYQWKDMFDLRP